MMFRIKQLLKMMLQHAVYPLIYGLSRLFHPKVDPRKVIFADAHHKDMPFSLRCMADEVLAEGYTAIFHFHDYTHDGALKAAAYGARFMWDYASAGLVFLCDNFLPAASCRKRKETFVAQLWHSCGLMKKMGYDTVDDIPSWYKGNVFANYDLVTVSAPACIPFMISGMRQPDGVVQATGVSRTDFYFIEENRRNALAEFYGNFPEARGKKVILWAPTFRGPASAPTLAGLEAMDRLKEALPEDWMLIKTVHPHIDADRVSRGQPRISDCEMPTERLLFAADLLITDYSTVFSDYLLLDRPFVLFAPDYEEYAAARGLVIDYKKITANLVTDGSALYAAVMRAYAEAESESSRLEREKLRQLQVSACDGKATTRILTTIRSMRKESKQ